jgi:hypothetical protein
MKTRRQLEQELAEAKARVQSLESELAATLEWNLCGTRGERGYGIYGDGEISIVTQPRKYAKFGHFAPNEQKAKELRDFLQELVPTHPMPKHGEEYWRLLFDLDYAKQEFWNGDIFDYAMYNAGRTWATKPAEEEVKRKAKVLSFDSSWRWVK